MVVNLYYGDQETIIVNVAMENLDKKTATKADVLKELEFARAVCPPDPMVEELYDSTIEITKEMSEEDWNELRQYFPLEEIESGDPPREDEEYPEEIKK